MPARIVVLALALVAGCAAPADNGLASTSSASCASCHADHGARFASSPHAHAAESPVFRAMLPRVAAAWGEAARARCEGCHAPPHGDDEAIGCVSCHAAVGNRGAHDARLVLDLEAPLLAPDADARAPHATRTSGLLTSSELCATCHEVSGPNLFVEHTGLEHAQAVTQTAAPACAGCHVPRIDDAPIAIGGAGRARHDHRFVGMDPAWGASEAEQRASSEASRALLASALELRFAGGALELENVGAAHAVPTGVAFFRDVWVDLEITHADGTIEEQPRVIALGDVPMRGEQPVALPTDADRIEARHLAPFEIRRFPLPADAVSARAFLRARAFRADALAALGLPETAAPRLEIASITR